VRLLPAALIGATVLVAGCATKPTLYTWGSYEDTIYVSYSQPGRLSPADQAAALEQDYQRARAANKRMPPGWHAHLGYLYYEMGQLDQARQELLTEKAEFPESAGFVDRLTANLDKR